MKVLGTCLFLILFLALDVSHASPHPGTDSGEFTLVLPSHNGQLAWRADGFTIVQSSAKPGGRGVGIRGKDASGRLMFLGFLFLFPGQAPMTSSGCREGILEPEKKANPGFRIESTSELTDSRNPSVALATYTSPTRKGATEHIVRAFVATGDICGDLEFYSEAPITTEDPAIKKALESYRFDPAYAPRVEDVFLYGQILYRNQDYGAAAPIFEQALAKIPNDKSHETMRRVTVDQAGMAYGISGNIRKARDLFEQAIASDPEYPLNYYNLACADAEEKKLDDARLHLKEAFARKANVIPGEKMPDPSTDDSFLPYRDNKDFWQFIESLH